MPDEMIDKKITQGQADRLAAPLELDLWAAFRVMEEDMLKLADGYEGTPEQFIDEVTSLLLPGSGENTRVNKELNMGICGTEKKSHVNKQGTRVIDKVDLDSVSVISKDGNPIKYKLAAGLLETAVIIMKAKALSPGTRKKRKDGTYEKLSDGSWKKVTDKKDDKKQDKQITLPKDLTTMTPQQNREVVNYYKKNFNEKKLDKRIRSIDAQIKREENRLKSEGVDFMRKPSKGIQNLFHNRKLHETAIEEIRGKKIK